MKDLDAQIQQVQARLKDLRAIARKHERRNETRRKIIYGAAILHLLDDVSGEKAEKLQHLLDERIRRESDRKFLGLLTAATRPESDD
ncbi:hypothetical protein [Sulfitobacter sabulilitoris]|uniref:Mobilization protein n=1 Tax=Sulfitobacter sabulilitoris TaxID=2562655 RepID=A0A5S3PL18_9RHOB|nr:hypothetical protein [Sulfitobacter sabulilitoris]TMM55124.1 hypothetical protein FDT80_06030 [Sulfitobacter sabulilitoris]